MTSASFLNTTNAQDKPKVGKVVELKGKKQPSVELGIRCTLERKITVS